MSQHTGSILALNLTPALHLLAGVGESELDEATLSTCVGTLPATDAAREQWHAQTLGRLELRLARGEGDRVQFAVEAPHGFGRAVDAVLRACGTYILQDALGSGDEARAQHP